MRALLVDDELNNLINLRLLLRKYCPRVQVVGEAADVPTATQFILDLQPELVFLDIQMPLQSGFELLKSVPAYTFEVIFVTAYDQYGIQAVRFSAIDYLLKPVDHRELVGAVDKAGLRIAEKKKNLQLENLVQILTNSKHLTEHRIALPSAREIRFVKTQDIVRCESENNYTTFFLISAEKIVVSKPMLEYDDLLVNYGFLRCHNSHMVNKRYVKSWLKEDSGYLVMEDGAHVPVSRMRKDAVKAALR